MPRLVVEIEDEADASGEVELKTALDTPAEPHDSTMQSVAGQRHKQALATPQGRQRTARLNALLLQRAPIKTLVKRSYEAYRRDKVEFALELSARALTAIRSLDQTEQSKQLDNKILLLSLRAEALLELKECERSKASMRAAIKCMALANTR